jgi:hypothetical protein
MAAIRFQLERVPPPKKLTRNGGAVMTLARTCVIAVRSRQGRADS